MKTNIAFLFILFSLIGYGQESPWKRWSDFVKQDADALIHEVTIKNALITTGFMGTMLLLSTADETLNDEIKKPYKGSLKSFLDATNELGNVRYTLPAALSVAGISLLTDDSKFQDAAMTSLESMFVTGGIVTVSKFVIGRSRPFQGKGAHDFHPFSGRTSFPSGHASSAFALITPWVFYYPGWFSYSLLIFPAGTAVARMALDAHWATDVIAGSAIGFLTGYTLTRWHLGGVKNNPVSLNWTGSQLSINYRF